jgi:hypothetical protein
MYIHVLRTGGRSHPAKFTTYKTVVNNMDAHGARIFFQLLFVFLKKGDKISSSTFRGVEVLTAAPRKAPLLNLDPGTKI